MSYVFTTLAIGEEYLENAIKLHNDLAKKCDADFNITTNEQKQSNKRHVFSDIGDREHILIIGNTPTFIYNLKVFAIKDVIEKDYDYIVFTDADWRIGDKFTGEKMDKLFKLMEKRNLDGAFERPCKVGSCRKNKNCFFKTKFEKYNLENDKKWDEADVPNEQFFVLKNTDKLKDFVSSWEEMLEFTIDNKILNYAEGFEMGVSALKSKMNIAFPELRHVINNCFEFTSINGGVYKKF
jgi:hypothetical protein